MPPGPDFYPSMTALYDDPQNVEGTTYGKRWLRHQWQQIIEEQATDNAETQKIVLAIHGGGIETGTSEIALATAGFHPATLVPSPDGLGLHDFWLFEGLLPKGNGRLHVTASNYDDPIATELVQNARRCISLHGCTEPEAHDERNVHTPRCRPAASDESRRLTGVSKPSLPTSGVEARWHCQDRRHRRPGS